MVEYNPLIIEGIIDAVHQDSVAVERSAVAFKCACSHGDALHQGALPFDFFEDFVTEAQLLQSKSGASLAGGGKASPLGVNKAGMVQIFADASHVKLRHFESLTLLQKVCSESLDLDGFRRALALFTVCVDHAQPPANLPEGSDPVEMLAAPMQHLQTLLTRHLEPYIAAKCPAELKPQHLMIDGVRRLFHIYNLPMQKVFQRFSGKSVDPYTGKHMLIFGPKQAKKFCEAFAVPLSQEEAQHQLRPLLDADEPPRLLPDNWGRFLLSLAFHAYSSEDDAQKYPTPAARLDAFLLAWARPYRTVFNDLDITEDCDYSQIPVPVLRALEPDRGSTKGGYKVLVQVFDHHALPVKKCQGCIQSSYVVER